MLCALIKQNLVVGVADLTDDEIAYFGRLYQNIIDCTNLTPLPAIGWAFDGANITGTNISRKITKLAMRNRFTTGELLGILAYITANPASVSAVLWSNLQVATFVDLSRSDTIGGVQYLTTVLQVGSLTNYLLTGARSNTILTTVPAILELYSPEGQL